MTVSWFGFLRLMSSPMRPTVPDGNPATFRHVVPPSSERWMPLPGPPSTSCHGVRCFSYIAA